MAKKLSSEEVINRIEKEFKNKYTFDKFEYKGMTNTGVFTCKQHGDFSKVVSRLVNDKLGCPVCGIKKVNKHTLQSFIAEGKKIWQDKFDYSLVDYKGVHIKVTLICSEHAHPFIQTPLNHLQGHNGCRKCLSLTKAKAAAQQKLDAACSDKLVTLYYLKVEGKELYKVGVTKLSLLERFGKKFKELEVVKTFILPEREAYTVEASLLELFKEHRVTYKGFGSGRTEFFNRDILYNNACVD